LQTEFYPAAPGAGGQTARGQRISVVIPVYNGAAYLGATLQSVMDQSEPPCEVIVVDDGSTDDTAAIARSFGVTLISQENRGIAAARNAGTRAATGEYIAYLDGDDLWSPDKLEIQLSGLALYGRPAFSFTDFCVFDENGIDRRVRALRDHPAFRKTAGPVGERQDVIIEAKDDRPVLPDDYILPSSTLIRRADVVAVGGFDETLRTAEDYEFFLRLFAIVPGIGVMRPLVLYRRHAAQVSAKPIALTAAFFEIARRVAASPSRYPRGDVRYIAGAAFLAYYRIGVLQARLGIFDEAIGSFASSLGARQTPGAWLGLVASQIGDSTGGRILFVAMRAVWRCRPRGARK
jgi:glycosyltransferase involved in cell wall biosynthesis